jgi:exodeoxyribonuclease VII small subunit
MSDGSDIDPSVAYGAAVAELEQILEQLERPDVDIDVLAKQVQRAAELIRACRSRIASARLEVETVVADLEDLGDGTAT